MIDESNCNKKQSQRVKTFNWKMEQFDPYITTLCNIRAIFSITYNK